MAVVNRNVRWIKSQKGKDQLVVDNYIFTVNGKGKAPDVRYWVCSNSNCVVSAKTDGQQLIDLKNCPNAPDHGHEDDRASLRDIEVKVRIGLIVFGAAVQSVTF